LEKTKKTITTERVIVEDDKKITEKVTEVIESRPMIITVIFGSLGAFLSHLFR